MPAKMVPVAAELSHIPEHQPVREITREQRNDLVKRLKGFPFTLCGLRGFSEAIITQGGVSVRDVDPLYHGVQKGRRSLLRRGGAGSGTR